MFSEIVQQGNAQLIDAPIIFHEFSAFVAEDVDRPDAGVFVVFGTSIACGGMEVESPMTGEGQAVTARNASALIVAGLARSIQFASFRDMSPAMKVFIKYARDYLLS